MSECSSSYDCSPLSSSSRFTMNYALWAVSIVGLAVILYFSYRALMRLLHSQRTLKNRVNNLCNYFMDSTDEDEAEEEDGDDEDEDDEDEDEVENDDYEDVDDE